MVHSGGTPHVKLWPLCQIQLHGFLDETDYLDPFQSGFRSDYGIETASVTLVDDLYLELDRVSMLDLDFSMAFSITYHASLLGFLSEMKVYLALLGGAISEDGAGGILFDTLTVNLWIQHNDPYTIVFVTGEKKGRCEALSRHSVPPQQS